MGAIKPHQPIDASEKERALARANCAARLRDRGEDPLALEYEMGPQDQGWAMRHEINRIRNEGGLAKPQADFGKMARG